MNYKNSKKLIAILTNHDDDIYCFRRELIEKLVEEQYEVLICCPYGPKIELIKNISIKYVDINIDRNGERDKVIYENKEQLMDIIRLVRDSYYKSIIHDRKGIDDSI